MYTKSLKQLLFAAAFAVLVCLIAVPVDAAGPYIEQTEIDQTLVIPAGTLCEFDVTAHDEGILRIKYWFDAQGNLMRELDSYRVKWTYSANGNTLKASNGGPSHITFISPTEVLLTYTGAYTHVTAPGRGAVFGSAGQGYEKYAYNAAADTWELVDAGFKAGNNLMWDPSAFCAALSQP